MAYRSGLMIKRAILEALRGGELKLKQLERKNGANSGVLIRHLEELEFLGHVRIFEHPKSELNGRPFRTVKLV